jgi:signal transduction histidine kinase
MTNAARKTPSVVQALERERKYLAEELHEGLCQNLCGISMQLKILQRRLTNDAPAFNGEFITLQQTLEQTIDEARFLYRTLYPPVTEGASMAQAIGEFAHSKGGSLECDESFFNDSAKIDPIQAVMFLRIAQEMLRNIAPNQSAGASIFLRFDHGFMKMRMAATMHDPQVSLDPVALEMMRTNADQIGANLRATVQNGQIEIDCSVLAVAK